MKKLILLFALLTVQTDLFCQGLQPLLDEGFGVLKMRKDISELKGKIKKTTKEKLKNKRLASGVGKEFTSVYLVSPAQLGSDNYFGLKITGAEVYFESTGDKNSPSERVAAFVIYTEKPINEEGTKVFRKKITEKYGRPNAVYSPDNKALINYSWFSDITLTTVVFGKDFESGDEYPYFEAIYESASG